MKFTKKDIEDFTESLMGLNEWLNVNNKDVMIIHTSQKGVDDYRKMFKEAFKNEGKSNNK